MALFQPSRSGASGTAAPQARHGTAGRGTAGHKTAGYGTGGHGTLSGYEAVQASRDFQTIRRRFGSFAGPVCALFIIWYFLFVIIAVFAPGFMRISVFGDVNVALCFGLLQFASTFAIAGAYRQWARRRLDPLADKLRHRLEQGGRAR